MDPISSSNLATAVHGGARLYTLDKNGRENITQILETSNYASESWLFGEANMNTYVGTIENSNICLLNRNDFLALMKRKPELSIQLLEQDITKVCTMHRQIQLLSSPKVKGQLLNYLQAYAKQVNKNLFILPLKMRDLALCLDTTPETLSCKFVLLEKQRSLKQKLRHVDLS